MSLDKKPLSTLFDLINPSQYYREHDGIQVKSCVQSILRYYEELRDKVHMWVDRQ